MKKYASNTTMCRQDILLKYFGDNSMPLCGKCDICIDNRKSLTYNDNDVIDGILYMLSNKPRNIHDFLDTLSFSKNKIIDMLSKLVDEGLIEIDSNGIYKKNESE